MRSHGHGATDPSPPHRDSCSDRGGSPTAAGGNELLLFDPQEPTEEGGGHRTSKRPRYTNGFGEVIRQLRLLGGRPTHDLTEEELATDMCVAKAYVDTGLEELQRRLGDQGGLQVEEAYGGGATAAKALSAATSKAMGGHRAWLTQSWLLTVMSLLQEGEALLEEQNHLPDVVHAADVVALQEGAEEQLGGLPAAERASPSAETSGGPSEPLDYPSVREQLDEHDREEEEEALLRAEEEYYRRTGRHRPAEGRRREPSGLRSEDSD